MPTIYPTQPNNSTPTPSEPVSTPAPSQPSGPRVVLSHSEAAPVNMPPTEQDLTESVAQVQPIQPPTQPIEPQTPVVPVVEPTTPEVETSEATIDATAQIHGLEETLAAIQETEQHVLTELETLKSQQAGLVSQMKKVIEKTGLIESKESQLESQLADLQEKRRALEVDSATPEEAPEEPVVETVPDEEVQTEATNDVAAEPVTEAAVEEIKEPAVEPPAPLDNAGVIEKLAKAFSASDEQIAEVLVTGAQVYNAKDHSLLVEFRDKSILFSEEDVQAAGLDSANLTMLPQISTDHLPEAVNVDTASDMLTAETIEPAQPATPEMPVEEEPVMEAPADSQDSIAQDSNVQNSNEQGNNQNVLLSKLAKSQNAEIISVLAQHPTVQRAANHNGIELVTSTGTITVPDAELLRCGVTGQDLADITAAATEPLPVPHVSEVQ